MAYLASEAFLVDETMVRFMDLVDLRVTPGGGFQVVWDESTWDSPAGAVFHQTSYRIFDATGQPLTDEITDAGYHGGDPPVRIRQSMALDDGTILKVDTVYNQTGPGSKLVLQLYDQGGAPLGNPVFTAFLDYGTGGLAQLPNRDIVFVADSMSKTGVGKIHSWVLDNTSPDLYAPVLTGIAGPDSAPDLATDGAVVANFNELIELAPAARIDLKTADGRLVDSFAGSDGAGLSAWVGSLTITPGVALDRGSGYLLEFAPGSVLDPSGNAFAGGSFGFTTAGGTPPPPPHGDATAPLAIDFYPPPDSHLLPPDWSPAITFDEEVRAGPGTITLETVSGRVVETFGPGAPGIQFFGASVLIDPAADLLPGTSYRLIAAANAFQDLAGNAAGMSFFSFTTAGEAPPPADTTPPTVIDFYPFPGTDARLPVDWSPAIIFSEAVQPGAGTITLETAAGAVVQTFAATEPGIHSFGASVLIDPAADLQPGTEYRLSASAGAFQDLAGNAARLTSFTFTTEAELVGVAAGG